VALHFGNQSPWSSANEKEIDSLVAWLIPTLGLSGLLTYFDPKRLDASLLKQTKVSNFFPRKNSKFKAAR